MFEKRTAAGRQKVQDSRSSCCRATDIACPVAAAAAAAAVVVVAAAAAAVVAVVVVDRIAAGSRSEADACGRFAVLDAQNCDHTRNSVIGNRPAAPAQIRGADA